MLQDPSIPPAAYRWRCVATRVACHSLTCSHPRHQRRGFSVSRCVDDTLILGVVSSVRKSYKTCNIDIIFSHRPPPENVVYDMRKFYHCEYIFKNLYEFCICRRKLILPAKLFSRSLVAPRKMISCYMK